MKGNIGQFDIKIQKTVLGDFYGMIHRYPLVSVEDWFKEPHGYLNLQMLKMPYIRDI